MSLSLIRPDWPAPPRVQAISTTRMGGVSRGVYASLNLGAHVGDDPQAVAENRQLLAQELALPSQPAWLNQVHGCTVARADPVLDCVDADALVTAEPGRVCSIMTADCLPLLFCDTRGERVAAAHAGWRGLLNGVIEATVESMAVPGSGLMAWLGPAIGPDAFEVGAEVRAAFVAEDPAAQSAFRPSSRGRWLADIYALARLRLARLGVHSMHGGNFCTLKDSERFFSFRRDGTTGRMATMIWIQTHEVK